MIDKLDAETVDEGKAHPFVVALVKELQEKLLTLSLSAEAASDESAAWRLLGRAAATREVIHAIARAKGRTE